jgi:virginiamycin A acetyltransferase
VAADRNLRCMFKRATQGLSLAVALPFAALAGFGRFSSIFQTFAHSVALVPGLPGDYLRVAYYVLTLRECSLFSRVSFGSFFAQSTATVGKGVYIGAYCVLGGCEIGERTQIASHVQILGGRYQHTRGDDGRIMGANESDFAQITIGPDCWIGAAAIVMADVGPGTTIGAGAVVTRPMPMSVVAVGNPARPLDKVMQ